MKVGDLVRNIYTQEIGLVTCVSRDYVDIDWTWHIPQDHLEVISESR